MIHCARAPAVARGLTFHRHGAVMPDEHGDLGTARLSGRCRPQPRPRPRDPRSAWRRAARIQVGCLTVVMPDGRAGVFGDPASDLRAEIGSTTQAVASRVLLHGETGAGEAYMDGLWSSPDLEALVELAALNRSALALSEGWLRVAVADPAHARAPGAGATRRPGAREHLGPLRPGQRLLPALPGRDDDVLVGGLRDARPAARGRAARTSTGASRRAPASGAGCTSSRSAPAGAGSRIYAAGELGCRVTSITISREQHDLARERVREAGLEHLVDIQLRDYRDIEGQYDAVVSIEMLEAVGAEFHATYFEAVDRALRPGGRFSLQVITFPDATYEAPAARRELDPDVHLPGRPVPVPGGDRAVAPRDAAAPPRCPRHRTAATRCTLRAWRDALPGAPRRRPGPGVRRPVHPDVGVLPRAVRGGLRDGDHPGPPDRAREGAGPGGRLTARATGGAGRCQTGPGRARHRGRRTARRPILPS